MTLTRKISIAPNSIEGVSIKLQKWKLEPTTPTSKLKELAFWMFSDQDLEAKTKED